MPEYDFHTLSPADFERFVCDLLNEELGLDLHSYPEGRDQGVDLLQVGEDGHRTVGQCKHYAKSDRSKLIASAKKEAGKKGRRTADRYIFVTSHPMSSETEAEVMRILGIPQRDVWALDKLNEALGRHGAVERRHPKLWLGSTGVLDSIVHAGCWHRAEASLRAVADRARFWVETPSYGRVFDLLERLGVCVITGAPGVGKTYLAEMIALQLARVEWEVVHVFSDIEQAWAVMRKDDTRQLFVYNDFLGEAELKPSAKVEAPDLHNFMKDILRRRDGNKRLIITTRAEVLQQASLVPSPSLQRLVNEDTGRFAIELSEWDEATRKEVIINHLHFAGLLDEDLKQVSLDRRLVSIIRHASYNPYLIEVICDQLPADCTAEMALTTLLDALSYPESVWFASFAVLGLAATEILLTMVTLKPRPVLVERLRKLVGDDGPAVAWGQAWRSLQPTWVTVGGTPTARTLVFAHPGCREYLLGKIDHDSDLAGERVTRAATLEQLGELARASGDLRADGAVSPLVHRPVIADALNRQRVGVAYRARLCTERELGDAGSTEMRLRILATSAALIGLYGSNDDSCWLIQRIEEILARSEPILTPDGLVVAVQYTHLPPVRGLEETTLRLAAQAVANARTLRDLDAYETFAGELQSTVIEDAIRPLAHQIIVSELEHLMDECDADIIRDTAGDLKARALFYGHEIDIDAVLEHADGLDSSSIN
ncbi:restriction endonuclease [Nonomuraea sp. NPDC049158]|uniref:nSTAND3 domain-containing NTPase n=1 Tax=Nonomuraea sp. NPDC049158 TaxID=3155649 RepID=UPI0033FB2D94